MPRTIQEILDHAEPSRCTSEPWTPHRQFLSVQQMDECSVSSVHRSGPGPCEAWRMRSSSSKSSMSRRRLLGAGVAAAVVSACTSESDNAKPASATPAGGSSGNATDTTESPVTTAPQSSGATPTPAPAAALTAADFEPLGACQLLPEQMAGPFPLDEQFDRRDITEGLPGQPMRLGLRVVDSACAPVPGAAVEVWHCDASGDYSAFIDNGGGKDEGPGTTFLRGTQTTGDDGIVEFQTIVPGWYTGRAVHVHLRVHLGGNIVLTTQMYFDADYLADVYKAEPYRQFGAPDTTNDSDSIAGSPAADGTLLRTTKADTSAGPGTLALLNLGVGR